MKIGFIGTGVMGTGMIANLLKAGNQVQVYNRTKAHAQKVLDLGAKWYDTPALAMQNCEVVMSIVGYPKAGVSYHFAPRSAQRLLAIQKTLSRSILAKMAC